MADGPGNRSSTRKLGCGQISESIHRLALDKLDRYVCLKRSELVIADGEESSDEDEDEDDEGSDWDDETQQDETESVTVVGDDEEREKDFEEIEVLDTIEEEKVRSCPFFAHKGTREIDVFFPRTSSANRQRRSWASRRTRRARPRT